MKGESAVKNQRASRRQWGAIAGRLALTATAAVLVVTAPFDWVSLGRTATLLAAGMQQPKNAAAVLGSRLTQVGTANGAPSLLAPPPSAKPDSTEWQGDDDTTEDIPVVSIVPPKENGTGGKVLERTLTDGERLPCGIATRNSSGRAVSVATAFDTKLNAHFTDTDAPQVLIVHTHTTEQYMRYDAGYYNASDRERTKNGGWSVVAAGEALKATLAAHGINAIHDTTVHDSPQYSGAYTRCAKTVQAYLDKYPSIQVVLDLHRDALTEGATGIVKPTVKINGKKAAQMMIITGVLSTDALPNPHWEQNLALAVRCQKNLSAKHDGLMRPLYTVGSRYNQHLHPGYLLVEIGGEGNTVAEAVYSAQLLGKTLVDVLK